MSAIPCLQFELGKVSLAGVWTLAVMQAELPALLPRLTVLQKEPNAVWDLSCVERLDSAAAILLWRTWGERWPEQLVLPEALRETLQRVAELAPVEAIPERQPRSWLEIPGQLLLSGLAEVRGVIALFGQLLLDAIHLFRYPGEIPWKEFAANVYKSGAQALPITAMVGFLIGITISYLSALQLRSFGADLLIVNILGISIVRELGPVLVAVLVAGRSGSAMTAQIGVMRVTEEIDALSTMGISRTVRVILPKIAGLTVAMPLLVLWTSAVAMFGGMLAALLQLDLSLVYFLDNLPRVVPVSNLYIGLAKGVFFGFIIALVACHFGLRVKPNTESLAANTTTSVVTAITMVIVINAVFAVLTRGIGVPKL